MLVNVAGANVAGANVAGANVAVPVAGANVAGFVRNRLHAESNVRRLEKRNQLVFIRETAMLSAEKCPNLQRMTWWSHGWKKKT